MIITDVLTHLIELTGNVADSYSTSLYVIDYDEEYLILRDHLSLKPKTQLLFLAAALSWLMRLKNVKHWLSV